MIRKPIQSISLGTKYTLTIFIFYYTPIVGAGGERMLILNLNSKNNWHERALVNMSAN